MSALKLLATSNYISVNKNLIKLFGLTEAVLLGELCSEYEYWEENEQLTDDGMFYCTALKLEANTGISEYQQRQAIQSLKNVGILETKLKGLPATKYFKINENKLLNFLQTSSEKIKELDVKKLNSSNNIIIKKEIKKSLIDKSIKDRGETPKLDFIKLYNEICTNLPKCVKVSDKRLKAINKLIDKYSSTEIQSVLEKANNSDFLTGKNDRGWKADIDFILREDKFINILENKYGGKQRISTKAGSDIGQHLNRVGDKQKFREDIANGKAEKF